MPKITELARGGEGLREGPADCRALWGDTDFLPDTGTALEWGWVGIALPTGALLVVEISPLGDGDRDMGVHPSPLAGDLPPSSGGSQAMTILCLSLPTRAAIALSKSHLLLISRVSSPQFVIRLSPYSHHWLLVCNPEGLLDQWEGCPGT